MKQPIILTVIVIALVGAVVFIFYRDIDEAPTLPTLSPVESKEQNQGSLISQPTPSESGEIETNPPTSRHVVITYSDSGYSPSTVRIKEIDIVGFVNNSSRMMWTASAVHPTHKAYPGSDIAKCGTPQEVGLFDACTGYGSGESWEFRFNEQGTWKYHNHLQPNHFGTIIVE